MGALQGTGRIIKTGGVVWRSYSLGGWNEKNLIRIEEVVRASPGSAGARTGRVFKLRFGRFDRRGRGCARPDYAVWRAGVGAMP
jgi:hypothetical protein